MQYGLTPSSICVGSLQQRVMPSSQIALQLVPFAAQIEKEGTAASKMSCTTPD